MGMNIVSMVFILFLYFPYLLGDIEKNQKFVKVCILGNRFYHAKIGLNTQLKGI